MSKPGQNPTLDGESRFGEIVSILSVASALSTFAVVLRCYCRHIILRSFGWDDAVMVVAQILAIASAVAIGLETKWGLGRHVWMMPKEHFMPYMKAFYSSIVVYNVAMSLTKISVILQYRRIFTHEIMQRITLYSLLFLSSWGITLSIMLPLVCVPVEAFWNPAITGRCLDFEAVWYVMAGVNVATDFALFVMPIPVISSLHLPRRQRAMLLVVFGLGVLPCAISIYRIRTLHSAAVATDPTWDNVGAATFSFLELTIGVVAVCLPTLRPVFVAALPLVFGSSIQSQKGSNQASIEDEGRSPRRLTTIFAGANSAVGRTCGLDSVLESGNGLCTPTKWCTSQGDGRCGVAARSSWHGGTGYSVANTSWEKSTETLSVGKEDWLGHTR